MNDLIERGRAILDAPSHQEYPEHWSDWIRDAITALEAAEREIITLKRTYNQLFDASSKDITNYKQRIAELEAENKMLYRSLAAKPDTATSSGAAQAAMQYEIEKRERRIAELKEKNQFLTLYSNINFEKAGRLDAALAGIQDDPMIAHAVRTYVRKVREGK